MNKRFDMLKQAHVANIVEYNQGRGEGAQLECIVLIIDELAYVLQEDAVEDVLVDVIARSGAVGIHPVLATQRPSSVSSQYLGEVSAKLLRNCDPGFTDLDTNTCDNHGTPDSAR